MDAPFKISNNCCNVMKKAPANAYTKSTGMYPIIATMADESFLRKSTWIKQGCNAFDSKHPKSAPMSFWTEQDVLQYIKLKNLPIASVYGRIEADTQRERDYALLDVQELVAYFASLVSGRTSLKTVFRDWHLHTPNCMITA